MGVGQSISDDKKSNAQVNYPPGSDLGNVQNVGYQQSRFFLNAGQDCTACPAHLHQNCATKFGTDWANCGEISCSGTGCESRCCYQDAAAAANRAAQAERVRQAIAAAQQNAAAQERAAQAERVRLAIQQAAAAAQQQQQAAAQQQAIQQQQQIAAQQQAIQQAAAAAQQKALQEQAAAAAQQKAAQEQAIQQAAQAERVRLGIQQAVAAAQQKALQQQQQQVAAAQQQVAAIQQQVAAAQQQQQAPPTTATTATATNAPPAIISYDENAVYAGLARLLIQGDPQTSGIVLTYVPFNVFESGVVYMREHLAEALQVAQQMHFAAAGQTGNVTAGLVNWIVELANRSRRQTTTVAVGALVTQDKNSWIYTLLVLLLLAAAGAGVYCVINKKKGRSL